MQTSLPENLTPIRYLPGGNTADLLLARDSENKRVVLRTLKSGISWSNRTYWRFLKGVSIREEVSPYPHIVNSLYRGKSRLFSRPYEVIEYLPGDNLKSTVARAPDMVERHRFAILRQVADVIAYLHENDFIHFDIKPENILLTFGKRDEGQADVQAKLTDFDLARKNTDRNQKLKAGSVHYMPPEQLLKGETGVQSDIFAFGVTAYYTMTKRLPFSGFSENEVLKQHLDARCPITPPKTYNPDIMQSLNDIVMACLEKDPNKRFPSMPYLLKELQKL